MTDKITIEIDGRACEATPGEMIITVADREGIHIPRFCYHKKLSVASNCRMCLVEVEQGGRPFPKPAHACGTPVAEGMRVLTRSPLAIDAQRGTMEFLLINHPLDCPICDQGGECELQDVAIGYGGDVSRYSERKRVVADEDLGPLIATDMTRCIHCTRCVRFGAEIAGVRELGATGRGEDMRIGTYVAHTVSHELSGNVIDLCPVGALTSKPFRFNARSWELTQAEGIAPHDAVGSNIHFHIRDNRVMRVHPKDNEAVNETWISDRDRFSYQCLDADDRLLHPMVKRPMVKGDAQWRTADWQEALGMVAEGLKSAGDNELGALVAPTATLEEMYLLQKIIRGLGGNHIDTRLRQQDFRGDAADAPLPWLGVPIAELEQQQGLLLIGTDIRQEQPLLAHRIRKAAMAGAQVALVNPLVLSLTFPSRQHVSHPAGMLEDLGAIAKALGGRSSGPVETLIATAQPDESHQETARWLQEAGQQGRGLILLGALAVAHPDYCLLTHLAQVIAEAAEAKVGYLPTAANSVGAYLAGALPHRLPGARMSQTVGMSAAEMWENPRKAYLLWGIEPAYDLGNPTQALKALDQAGLVVACTTHRSPSLEQTAHIMLPIAAFAETSGTFVNAGATWQSFRGAVAPPGEVRPGWKLLRVLGNLLDLPGFDQVSSTDVLTELQGICNGVKLSSQPDNRSQDTFEVASRVADGGLARIGNLPIYAVDALVRRAPALQHTPAAVQLGAFLRSTEASAMGLAAGDLVEIRQNGSSARMPVGLDDAVPAGCVRIPAGVAGSEDLGDQIGPISVTKV
ncbi:NADH-quinone oxidoreductase subunit NuoG [Candidatus Thiosymbion oneisti]|uniref:NADH-quinone oxidoreductase subunit NuoG n=1 Tax=Candidatus Thiosymbion oneisti TaxID=589554 RepID=UPI000AF2C410|nr:NADH-quinone oxidoreductase subunit NuoG [Candidatus Thiosymbion oneisti]